MFFAAAMLVALALYAWRHAHVFGAGTFGLFLLPIGLWSLGAAFETLAGNPEAMLFWAKFQYLGIVALPVFWLRFTLHYTGRPEAVGRRELALLWLVPLATLALVWTNDLHQLIWTDVRLDSSGPFPDLVVTRGPWFWLGNVGYGYLLLLTGTVILIRDFVQLPGLHRQQSAILIVAALIPWVANGIYVFGDFYLPIDPTPLAFAASGLAMAFGLFRLRLFNLMPTAYRMVFDSLPDNVVVVDEGDRILAINPAAITTFGLDANRVVGRPASGLIPIWPGLVALAAAGRHTFAEHQAFGEVPRYFEAYQTTLLDPRGRRAGRIVIARNVSKLKYYQERADLDPLTGLPNRRRFADEASRALSLAARERWVEAVLYLDLDNFKSINDRFGHEVGDEVLRRVANTMQNALRTGDLIARFGGDEFVVMLNNADTTTAVEVAQRILSNMSRPAQVSGEPLDLGLSIGIAFYPHHSPLLSELITLADGAMYRAKRDGGGVALHVGVTDTV